MPEVREKIIMFNQSHKFIKIPFIKYVDTEPLLEKYPFVKTIKDKQT